MRFLPTVEIAGCIPYSMNDRQVVIGVRLPPHSEGPRWIPVIWENGEMRHLANVGEEGAIPRSINNAGEVVGYSVKEERALLWRGDEIFDLGDGIANSINDDSMIVGRVGRGPGYPAIWRAQTLVWTGTQPGTLLAVNAEGQAAGALESPSRAIRLDNLNIEELPVPAACVHSVGAGINDLGEVVGWGRFAEEEEAVGLAWLGSGFISLEAPNPGESLYLNLIDNEQRIGGNCDENVEDDEYEPRDVISSAYLWIDGIGST